MGNRIKEVFVLQLHLTLYALRFLKWRRIGWKNVCGASMGKGRAIFKGWVGATSRPQANGLLCRGKFCLLSEKKKKGLKASKGKKKNK